MKLKSINSGLVINVFSSQNFQTELLMLKTTAVELLSLQNPEYETEELNAPTKTHLIKHATYSYNHQKTLFSPMYCRTVYANLESDQLKRLTKKFLRSQSGVEALSTNPEFDVLESVANNKPLLTAFTVETLKIIARGLEDTMDVYSRDPNYPRLSKALSEDTFEGMNSLPVDAKEYFEMFSEYEQRDISAIDCDFLAYVDVLHRLQLPHLEERYQLGAVFVLLALKRAAKAKKLLRRVDELLRSLFEISPKHPDLYKLFPVEYLFDFEAQLLMKLLTLNIDTSNPLLLIKCLLETAVKKVKTDAEVVKCLVKTLLTNQKVKKEDATNIEYFADPVFQTTCLVLPIIAKEKKAITNSVFRTILADLQEKLHKALLKSFKRINISNEKSRLIEKAGDTVDSEVAVRNATATLDAMEAFSLTLSKYCETTNAEDMQNLDYLWTGLEFFVENAVSTNKLIKLVYFIFIVAFTT